MITLMGTDNEIRTDKKVVTISDVHLGVDHISRLTPPNRDELKNFLWEIARGDNSKHEQFHDIGHLVLNGDIEDHWRRNVRSLTRENYDIYNLLAEIRSKDIQIHYIQGNHDWYPMQELRRLRQRLKSKPELRYYDTMHRDQCHIEVRGTDYRIKHGYQYQITQRRPVFKYLVRANGDVYGNAMEDAYRLWRRGEQQAEKSLNEFREMVTKMDLEESPEDLGVAPRGATSELNEADPDEVDWLCIGHTHKAGVRDNNRNRIQPSNAERGVVNSGSWKGHSTFLTLSEHPRIWEWNNGDPEEHTYPLS